jgi:hypothetical protein
VQGQGLPAGERFSIVLSGDPFKREEELNEQGHKDWEAIMAQQPAIGRLNLHFVLFTRTPRVKAVDYKVAVAECLAEGDLSLLGNVRGQLALQANEYRRNGWTLLQELTGQRPEGKSFFALLLKRPIY